MRYGDNKPRVIRRIIFAVLIAVAVILQNSAGGLLEFFGARVFLVIPVCVCVSMFEREVAAAIFGAFAGVLWDISSVADGFNSFVLMILCAVCSLLISRLMRNNALTSLVLGAAGVAVYEIAYLFVRLFSAGTSISQLLGFYLPSFVITALVTPICYFVIKEIYNRHKTVEE